MARDGIRYPRRTGLTCGMSEERIRELEGLLATANESVARLTLTNTELSRQLGEAETRNKKLRRSSRNEASAFRDQLASAQRHRG